MQQYWIGYGDEARVVTLPGPDIEVLPGVPWGRGDALDTPAYWALRCETDTNPLHGFCRPGGSLVEEVGFCMLGGFGITMELNIAAYERLADAGVFDLESFTTEDQIRSLLCVPLSVFGKSRRYRFPNQRAARLAAMRKRLSAVDYKALPEEEAALILRGLPGIGPKTAAWILRNHYGSDSVAILDIHVIRACIKLGVFPSNPKLPQDYEPLQQRFLELADKLAIKPSILDAVMWTDMRSARHH
jgi:thermostable 8-oxoguanine DNA glycosylase